MHERFGDVFDDNRDVKVPCTYSLVVRRRGEPSILIDESDRIHRSQMLVIFLRDLTSVYVVLTNEGVKTEGEEEIRSKYLDDLLV